MKDNKETVEAIMGHPALFVHPEGKVDADGKVGFKLPEKLEDVLPNARHVTQAKGSITQESFENYLMKQVLPFWQEQFPDLEKDVKDVFYTYDLPSIHNVSDRVLEAFREAGIILYGLPSNSTAWSQPCDSRLVFGAFKKEYYKSIDEFLVDWKKKSD